MPASPTMPETSAAASASAFWRCSTSYAATAAPPPRPQRSAGLFEQLFGSDEEAASYEPPPSVGDQSALEPAPEAGTGGTNLRTICVRKCDGFFFPISFSDER